MLEFLYCKSCHTLLVSINGYIDMITYFLTSNVSHSFRMEISCLWNQNRFIGDLISGFMIFMQMLFQMFPWDCWFYFITTLHTDLNTKKCLSFLLWRIDRLFLCNQIRFWNTCENLWDGSFWKACFFDRVGVLRSSSGAWKSRQRGFSSMVLLCLFRCRRKLKEEIRVIVRFGAWKYLVSCSKGHLPFYA